MNIQDRKHLTTGATERVAPRWKSRARALPGLLAVMVFSAPAFGHPFVGEWVARAQIPGNLVSEEISVKETDEGYEITAKLVGAPEGTPEAGPGHDIVMEGDSFSYKRTVESDGSSLEIVYTGVVSGDRFTGTVTLGGSEIPYNGVRADEE